MAAALVSRDTVPKTDSWDRYLSQYLTTGAGAHDFLDVVARTLQVTRELVDDLAIQDYCGRVSGKVSLIRDAFAIQEFLEAVFDLKGHVSDLTDALDRPESDPGREIEVALAIKNLTKNGLGLGCSGSDMMMFLDQAKIVPLSPDIAQTFEGIFWITLGVLSGWDLIDQVSESDRCHAKSQQAHDPLARDYYAKRGEVANIRLIKDVTAVAMAALSLVSLLFTTLTFYSAAMLALSCVYVILKVASYFYQRTIDDQEKLLRHAFQGKF
ncbi:MAG: hypothetical protein K940chlam2_00068 [Chlamydiae bacterium]|nr:hypothetical protein [Chlamydiota bacterium]